MLRFKKYSLYVIFCDVCLRSMRRNVRKRGWGTITIDILEATLTPSCVRYSRYRLSGYGG
jgi:hypothetical protein